MNRQLLYLIESGGMYKIGISADINSRIAQLQTASPYVVRCVAYYKTDRPAIQIERALHKLFSKYRLQGEWFDFEDKFTQEAFDTLCEKYGMYKLPFLEDGTCCTVPKEVKVKAKFGDVPDYIPTSQQSRDDQAYWRRKYGIKTKSS